MIKNKFPELDITKLTDSDEDKDVLLVLHTLFNYIEAGNNVIHWSTVPALTCTEENFNSVYDTTWHDVKFHCCEQNDWSWDITIEPLETQSPQELFEEYTQEDSRCDYAYYVGSYISELLDRNFDFLWFPGVCGTSNTHEINKSLKFWLSTIAPQYSHITFEYKPFSKKSKLEETLDNGIKDIKGGINVQDIDLNDLLDNFDDLEHETYKEKLRQLFYDWQDGIINFENE